VGTPPKREGGGETPAPVPGPNDAYSEHGAKGDDRVEVRIEPDERAQPQPRFTRASDIDLRRHNLSKALASPTGAARYVVGAEDRRVEELLDERPHPENQQRQSEIIDELDASREQIMDGIVKGVDDVAIDARLGLRTDDSVLPPIFRELHRQAEEDAGHEITFLKWMTDYASNTHLLNVWQWHDHHLSKLDDDPAFQEQISLVKTEYTEGSQKAIDAGALHPDIAVQKPEMDAVSVVHGSPFSPTLANAYAFGNRDTSEIQVREGVSDILLYHEVTHLLNGGLISEFDEAATDLIAGTVYNHSNPEREHVDPSNLVYPDQAASLAAIERMTGGKMNLYELSRIYSGPDHWTNTIHFGLQVDEAVGLPITLPLVESSREIMDKMVDNFDGATVPRAAQLLVRVQTEFLAAMMFDNKGNKVASTVHELANRMLSPGTLAKYDIEEIHIGLSILAKVMARL
jgi:hypothetical protein